MNQVVTRAAGSPLAAIVASILLHVPLLGQVAATARDDSAEALLSRTIESPEYRPHSLSPVRWLDGGAAYLRLAPSAATPGLRDIVRYETASGSQGTWLSASRLIPAGAGSPLKIEDFTLSADGRRLLIFTNSTRGWANNTRGDYWAYDRETGELRQLGGDAAPSSLMFAKFSPDGSKVAYVSRNDLYVEDLAHGGVTRLTATGSNTLINGASDWVNEEELDISDGFRWSPDGQRIAFWQFDTNGVGRYTLVYDLGDPDARDSIVTSIPYSQTGPYPQTLLYPYPMAGTTNSAVRVGVVGIAGGRVVWMNLPGDPREHYVARMGWASPDSLVIQQLNRLQNTNRVFLASPINGAARQVFVDRDSAWVDYMDRIEWLNHGRDFLYLSERDGWRRLYRVSRADGIPKPITGKYDVVSLDAVCERAGLVYFTASPHNPTARYLYRAPIDGSGNAMRVSPDDPGTNRYDISPDCHWAVHSFSSMNTAPFWDLVRLPDHRVARNLVDNVEFAKRLAAMTGGPVEFLRLDAGGGVTVDGWLMKPPGFAPSKKYPLIVRVYSEPAWQTTVDACCQMDSRVLASAGYLVASFDNQGTPAPRGRAWRKAVYGNIGSLSSAEQRAALRSLEKSHPYVDPGRVGVWGWSGGGTETLNLMFRYPRDYSVGVSVAPVPDRRLYDTIYEERYLGLPQQDSIGYKLSSPVNFADGLEGDLLVMHGSGDDNVHFQGFELLVNRLIELGKRFDMRVYPARAHGISEGPGTELDVDKHILWYFLDHL